MSVPILSLTFLFFSTSGGYYIDYDFCGFLNYCIQRDELVFDDMYNAYVYLYLSKSLVILQTFEFCEKELHLCDMSSNPKSQYYLAYVKQIQQ